MKTKKDAVKGAGAAQPAKGKRAEFKPFWQADQPKKDEVRPQRKKDQSVSADAEPKRKAIKKSADQVATPPGRPTTAARKATVPAGADGKPGAGRQASASAPEERSARYFSKPAHPSKGGARPAAGDAPMRERAARLSEPKSGQEAKQGQEPTHSQVRKQAEARNQPQERKPWQGLKPAHKGKQLQQPSHRAESADQLGEAKAPSLSLPLRERGPQGKVSPKAGKTSDKGGAVRHHIAPAPHKLKHQERHGDLGVKLHSGQIIEVSINGTTSEGFGVSYFEGNRVLVAGGILGEQLLVKVTYVGRRESFANTIRCIRCSPDRNPSPVCHMGRCCDNCGLMQMRYPAQLAWKTNLVTREIGKYPSLAEAKVFDTLASPQELSYRNTAKLVVGGKYAEPVIGIYRRNTHDVLEIDGCPLHHPLINKVVKATKIGIKKGKVPIYNPKSEMGLLRYLVVRVAEPGDRVMVVFVTSDQGYNEIHHLAKYVQEAVPEVAVVAQNINTSSGNVILGPKERFITKAQTLRASLGEKSFSLSPHSFFQVNSGAAQIIYEKVRELAALTGAERVIDVYCGIGGISLFLADQAGEVVGIEMVEAAVADATKNAALNGAENCEFEAGDAAKLIDEIGEEGGADLIVLNPPRKGCEERVLKSVAGIKPGRIIYVSCSPETLARDLDILFKLGYRTKEVHPVDMFPQTIHVEDVALLERM